MTKTPITSKRLTFEEYESLIASLPAEQYVPFEQSAVWTRINADNPARRHYGFFTFYEGEELVALASVYRFVRRIRESMVLITGPVYLAPRTAEREQALIDALTTIFDEDPEVDPLYIRLHIEHPDEVKGAVLSIERGLFEREVIVDLGKTPEELKKSFSSTARRRINGAERAGVEIREITENRSQYFTDVCFPIMQETADRDAFALLPIEIYQSTLDDAAEYVRLFVAYAPRTAEDSADSEDKIPVAWMMTNEYHYRGCYYYGGSSKRAQETGAMFALMFRILNELTATGNTAVGLTGISSPRYPELAGVENFKMRFSKKVAEYPSLFDVPLKKARYKAVRAILKTRSEGPAKAKALAAAAKEKASELKQRGGTTTPAPAEKTTSD